jgi:hypothetical protein
VNIDSCKECSESEYYDKSLLSKYKRFSTRYLRNEADQFDVYDWENISLFAPLDISFILRFKRKLIPTNLMENISINPNTFKFLREIVDDDGACCIIVFNDDNMYRKIARSYSWK